MLTVDGLVSAKTAATISAQRRADARNAVRFQSRQPIYKMPLRSAQRREILQAAFRLVGAAREAEAIPLYKRAIRAGLKGESLRDALVCLGSSLITVGKAKEAVRYLKR